MPGSSSPSPAASVRVLPATEAEIDLDGRQLISEKHVARLFQGRQMESGLKVSVAPLSAVNLTLWKDFFLVFFRRALKSVPSLVSKVEERGFKIAPQTKQAIRSAQISIFKYYLLHLHLPLCFLFSEELDGEALTHFHTPPCPHYMNHKLIIAPLICSQLLQCIVTVLYGVDVAHTTLEPGRRQERLV